MEFPAREIRIRSYHSHPDLIIPFREGQSEARFIFPFMEESEAHCAALRVTVFDAVSY